MFLSHEDFATLVRATPPISIDLSGEKLTAEYLPALPGNTHDDVHDNGRAEGITQARGKVPDL